MAIKLAKVLIVFKKSTFQLQAVEHREPRFLKLLEEGHTTLSKVKTAHDEHYETLQVLCDELNSRRISYSEVARADLTEPVSGVDLVISVGGDGTFLDASHAVLDTPIVGINSAKSTSFGHFCIGDRSNVKQILDEIESGTRKTHPLLRLEAVLNGKCLPELILNEVLICHSNPAGTSRYYIQIDGHREEQRSSGIWISTAAGSTGSLKSAGGEILPVIDKQIQYVVREPWTRPGQSFAFVKGKLHSDQSIQLTSHMRTGALYIDGQHIEYSFSLGEELEIRASKQSLTAFVDPDVNKIFTGE